MEEITKRLRARFPLIGRLSLGSGDKSLVGDGLPPYFGFLLAVVEMDHRVPVCFIFPRRGEAGRLAAVLFAFHRFTARQRQLMQSYGEQNFQVGDTVRVHPGRHVFRYGGFDADSPELIWLGTIDGTGRWSVPAAEVVPRLEKTTQRRPVGRLDSPILSPPPAALDTLLGTSCFGNHGVMKNEVAILDSVSGLSQFVESTTFHLAPPDSDTPVLKTLLPFGEISQPATPTAGWFKKWDDRNPTGEPLIAATHSAEVMANYCIDAKAFTKLVVVNGLSRLRNLQSYDDMAQMQRLVLFADYDDEEMIEALGNRDCRFWHLESQELQAGNGATTNGILGSVSRWARNQHDLRVDDEPCENQKLDEINLRLEKLRNAVLHADEGPLTRLVSRAWRMFGDACNKLTVPAQAEREHALAEVNSFRIELQRNCAWILPETAQALVDIADAIAKCYDNESRLGVSKGAALYRALSEAIQAKNKIALLARNENKVGQLRQWVHQRGFWTEAEVYSPRTLPDNEHFDRLICVSWPGAETMKQVVSKLAAPRITVVGYPCERHWLRQCQPRFKSRPQVPSLTGKEKASFVSGEQEPKISWPEESTPPLPVTATAPDSGIWNFERQLRAVRIGLAARPTDATETVPARYVRFAGDFYALLTEPHRIPVATDLVSGRARPNQKLPERTVLEIKPGDFVVFPESGDREFVQELADKLIGPTAPQLRKLARRWKDALQTSGMTPDEFQLHARGFNRPRHPATVRHWFADTSQIGPREKDDLLLIALVTGNQQFEAEIEDVRLAIERLWSTHLSAGMRLRDALLQRLPQVMGQVEENGTKVDLGELGSAWIVHVEAIAPRTEPRGRAEVNRLLSEESGQDLTYLL